MQTNLINQFVMSLRDKLRNGRPPEEVMELCRTHFQRRDIKPNYYYFLLMGEASSRLGKFKDAVFLLTKALQENQTAEVYGLLGHEYYRQGSLKQAVLFIQKAVSLEPENLKVLTFLCEIYIDLEKNREIFALLEQLDKKALSSARMKRVIRELRSNLSKLAMKKKKYPLALKISKEALERDGGNFIHHESLGISLLQMGRYKEALKYLEKSRSLHPLSSKYRIPSFEEKKKEAGNIKEKIMLMEQELSGMNHKDENGEKHFDLGFLYFYNGEHRKALNAFHRALDLKIGHAG